MNRRQFIGAATVACLAPTVLADQPLRMQIHYYLNGKLVAHQVCLAPVTMDKMLPSELCRAWDFARVTDSS